MVSLNLNTDSHSIPLTTQEAAAIVSGIYLAVKACGGCPEAIRESLASGIKKIDDAFGFQLLESGDGDRDVATQEDAE